MTGAPYEPPQAPPQGHVPPPRTSRSLLETVRPTEGRMVGGVCEGVGRQLGIDPVVLRVVLAVLTLVGLAGVVVYGAAWLVLPDQRTGRSIAQDHLGVSDRREPQVRPVVLVAAAVAAGLSVLGLAANGPWGWGTPFSWFGLLIAGVVLWWVFGSRRGRSGPTGPAGTPPPAPPPPSTAPTATWAPSGALPAAPVAGPPPSAGPPPPPRTWAAPPPPPAPRPPRPPNPRHDGGHLALTCLALALVAAGAVGIWSVVVEPLPWGAYPAAVLGVLGLGMLLGSVVGNAWPLTVPTFLAAVALAVTTVIPTPTAGDVLERPTTASQVSSDYTLGVGRIVVDLTDVDDPAALEGRTLEIENGLGEVQVVVPPDLSVEVSTYVRAGQTEVFDRVSSGNLVRLRSGEPAGPHLRVVSTQWAGRTVVTRS